ncbi:hypothetical protein PPERSA_04128 [Pseudocohnilembus persalinus]|uniref:Attractin/MKLN-like beta-propeller domain-containing protein n=1 Tax=Pseudocohnilembus persalinus TaxID=266149 RepID=A0A0V0QND4_PSEPJ|nr:hypothetical protein PPERSA_04128 [Pseudocohnilembus persalinus]|eukprot:KRX03576.1 hypothetical protein PPERSA_04128 [Pseudocohnilembus persalinus]
MNQIPPNYYQNNISQNNHQQNLDNQSQQICLSHHQLWSHACLSSTCSLQPLCGKCIKQHNQFHKDKNQYPEIETIEDIKHECLKLNENIIQLYEKELNYVQQTIKQKGYDPSIQFETLQGIRKVKDLVQEQIDFYFQQLEGQFQNYQSTIDNHEQIKQKEKKYKKEIEELQQQIYKIKNEKTDILLLKKIMNQKPDDEINQFKFTNSVNLHTLNNPANIYRDSIGKQLAFNNQIENLHVHIDEDFEINVQDYFEKDCNKSFLHFFQHKSKIFHFVNLEDLKMGLPPKFYQINLNINFNIPRWHKSISLPDGQVVITGGVSCEIKDKKLNNCYQLDFTNRKLLPIPSMILARSGHSLVYFQEEIYAIGGFSEQMIFTSRCEKFSFSENKWVEIAELNQRANNPTVCSFNNKYIFKFGGKFDDNKLNQFVEKYDPKINKWQIIQFSCPSFLTPNQTLLTSACCLQINRSQILIFGGTQENYTAKSDNCYIFQVDHNGDTGEQTNFSSEDFKQNPQLIQFSVKRFGEKSLPNKDGFWNNQAIIYKNKLYCLQNVSSEDKQQAVYLDRRRVLSFDSQKWVSLNKYELKEFNSNKVGSVIFQ